MPGLVITAMMLLKWKILIRQHIKKINYFFLIKILLHIISHNNLYCYKYIHLLKYTLL